VGLALEDDSLTYPYSIRVGQDGRFEAAGLLAGTHRLTLRSEDGRDLDSTTARTGERATLRLPVKPEVEPK
jgi:hypothetical protein